MTSPSKPHFIPGAYVEVHAHFVIRLDIVQHSSSKFTSLSYVYVIYHEPAAFSCALLAQLLSFFLAAWVNGYREIGLLAEALITLHDRVSFS